MNATLAKFGHPGSLIRDYRHWCVLLRSAQVTLGSLILGAKSEATAFSQLSRDAFAELHQATSDIETALSAFRPFGRINYLMLMMVDPHVHFHVLPRYGAPQDFEGVTFADPGWPGPPDLKTATSLADQQRMSLLAALRAHWPKS